MITKWKVFNFKSIREEAELDLAPLTIFAGANSSGKSTFIQSILLVAQTLAHKVGSRSVVLNGAHTSLGQFDDLKSNDSESDQITVKCTFSPLAEHVGASTRRFAFTPSGTAYYGPRFNQLKEIVFEISFDADPSSVERDIFQIQPRLYSTLLSCTVRDEDNIDQKAEISIRHRHSDNVIYEIDGIDSASEIDDQLRSSLAYEVDIDDSSIAEVKEEFKSARPIGCILRHFLPEQVIYEIDTLKEDANAIVNALQDDGRFSMRYRRTSKGREIILSDKIIAVLREVLNGTVNFDEIFTGKSTQLSLFELEKSMTFRDWYECIRTLSIQERGEIQQKLRDRDDLYDKIYNALLTYNPSQKKNRAILQFRPPRQLNEAAVCLDDFFATSLKYLGPLRDAPKPLYPLAPAADPHDVGLRGEHTASILDLHKNKKIKYIPSVNFKSAVVDRTTATRTLESAVIDWLQYLGVASSVKSRDQGKLGHELKVGLSSSDSTHDLTHVGVGVSQVLPILVICLLADTDSTLVFEQPELHLHPKVQTLLGDFFLSMALCNKQCIVETHSEYFIDRLRFRIAAASPENELNSQAKIYFVEKPSQTSSFREVVINEYGAISDWPEGFFDQSQQEAEAILRAAAMKRKASRRKNDA